jgi:hypothetical protein
MQFFDSIPRLAIIAVVILALIGAVWFWRRWKSSSALDKEVAENVKAQRHAAVYAKNVARGLDLDDEHEGAVTAEYAQEIARGLADAEDADDEDEDAEDADDDAEDDDAEDDDEEYEPMD